MIRLLITLIGTYLVYRLARWAFTALVSGSSSDRIGRASEPQDIKQMEKDPVCGKYVLAWEARRSTKNGKTYYFCSAECQDRFLGKN